MLKKKGVRQHFVLGGDGTQKGKLFLLGDFGERSREATWMPWYCLKK